jgi:hypothetical protein
MAADRERLCGGVVIMHTLLLSRGRLYRFGSPESHGTKSNCPHSYV